MSEGVKTVPPIGPAATDLQDIAAEHAASLPEAKPMPQAQTPAELWAKAKTLLTIQPEALRRRALMQLSVIEMEKLCEMAFLSFPVVQAYADFIATRAKAGPHEQVHVHLAEARAFQAIYPSLDPETRKLFVRHA